MLLRWGTPGWGSPTLLFMGEVSTRVLREWSATGTDELGAAHTKIGGENAVKRWADRQNEVVRHRTRHQKPGFLSLTHNRSI